MTDEEKDIYNICLDKKSLYCLRRMGEETCNKCKTYQMYRLGLAEGRKEIEQLKKDCSIWESRAKGLLHKNEMVDVYGLQKENAELKEQVESLANINIKAQNIIAELKEQNESLKNTLQAIATDTNEHITHNVAQNELDKWESAE